MFPQGEQDQLFEGQTRVYEVLDVATKPAQWFLGGLKLLLLAVVVVVMLVGTPFYLIFTGQHVSSGDILIAFNAIAALVLFFLCPYYVVIGAPLYFGGTAMWMFAYHPDWWDAPWFTLRWWFFVWVAIGYGWYFVKQQIFKRPQRSEHGQFESETAPTGVRLYHPLADNIVSGDSPLPEHLRPRVCEHLQSIIDECEAVLRVPEAEVAVVPQHADVDLTPLPDAIRSTNEMFVASSARMQELIAETERCGAYGGWRRAAASVRQCLAMQQEMIDRMAALLARLKREAAPFPVVELERVLEEVRAGRVRIERVARAKGLI